MSGTYPQATEGKKNAAYLLAGIGIALALLIGGYIGWTLHMPTTAPSSTASSVTATVCARGYVGANGANEPLGDNNTGPQAVIQLSSQKEPELAIYAGWMRDLQVGKTYRFTYTHDAVHDSDWVSSVPVRVAQGAACT